MPVYAGFRGRIMLQDTSNPGRNWNLLAYRFYLNVRSQEEDVTTAQSQTSDVGRLFVASQIPRIDLQCEAFWTQNNNPFGNAEPFEIGFTYRCGIQFDHFNANTVNNVDGTLLILAMEMQSGVRDVVRYTLSGVFNGAIRKIDNDPYYLPSSDS